MVIAKPIYEPLPFAYLLIAVGLVYWLDNPFALASAVLFYCAGALIWVQTIGVSARSAHHRAERPQPYKNPARPCTDKPAGINL